MSNYEVVGIQKREYNSKKTGQRVVGFNIFVQYPLDGVDGMACESFWLSDSVYNASPFHVGDIINVMYNKYGRITFVAHA